YRITTLPPSSSGLGCLVLSQKTGVRVPLGVSLRLVGNRCQRASFPISGSGYVAAGRSALSGLSLTRHHPTTYPVSGRRKLGESWHVRNSGCPRRRHPVVGRVEGQGGQCLYGGVHVEQARVGVDVHGQVDGRVPHGRLRRAGLHAPLAQERAERRSER